MILILRIFLENDVVEMIGGLRKNSDRFDKMVNL